MTILSKNKIFTKEKIYISQLHNTDWSNIRVREKLPRDVL